MEQAIVIIGAGAAGLLAARELSKKGYKLIITEADKRVGGRVHTLSPGGLDPVIEAGAEFIHGKLPITLKLLNEAGINYERISGEMYQVKDGNWKRQEEMAVGWDELMKKMRDLKEDMSIGEFLQKYFSAPKYAELRESTKRFAEGFDVADISKASVLAVRQEWGEDMEDTFRVKGGYGTLINFLKDECIAAGCELHTSFVVKNISWKRNAVQVKAADGREATGNKSIITVPVGILQGAPSQKAAIHFEPAIDQYIDAAKKIGYGPVIKLFYQFRDPFWNNYMDDIGFIFSQEIIPTWWTQLPDKRPLLTGWLGGGQVNRAHGASEEEIARMGLESLSGIFKKGVDVLQEMLVAQEVQNWINHPFAAGAYSYSTLQTEEARKVFELPVDETLFFAGEGYHETESSATVEAAFASAEKMVKLIR